MRRAERPAAGPGSPGCPDLLLHVGGPGSPLSPLFLSFFEEECSAIAARLRVGAAAAAGPSPGGAAAGPVTSTPVASGPVSSTPVTSGPVASAPLRPSQPPAGDAPGATPGEPRPRSRLARPQPRRAARLGTGQGAPGRSGPPGRSPGSGAARPSLGRPRASLGREPPRAGRGPGAPAARLALPSGTKPKPAAKPRLQHPGGAPQLALPSAVPRPTPRDKETETAAKAAGHRQPSKRLSTAIPTVASRSRLRPPGRVASPKRSYLGTQKEPEQTWCSGSPVEQRAALAAVGALPEQGSDALRFGFLDPTSGSTTQELLCNRTRELKENGKADQTWVCVGSPSPIVLPPVPAPGCGEAAPAEQLTGLPSVKPIARQSPPCRLSSEQQESGQKMQQWTRTVSWGETDSRHTGQTQQRLVQAPELLGQ
ncbi:transcription initiation factor TFIID subunit 4-like isoform X2 [Cygnus atratus]|uniref:transcription initiation factor TFIID subunit 4-like isoform X2 n=1 Tax=Cygnus atratus TaxID=8868 RepID=UPI0021B7937B|nr:transcription initiation factor TFIID subunit 4-like isoform X2 [Cygnus atratus]